MEQENIIDFDDLPEMNQEPRYIKEVELPSGMTAMIALTKEEIVEVKRLGAQLREELEAEKAMSSSETETGKEAKKTSSI